MNEQNLNQFLAAARQYFFELTTVEADLSTRQVH